MRVGGCLWQCAPLARLCSLVSSKARGIGAGGVAGGVVDEIYHCFVQIVHIAVEIRVHLQSPGPGAGKVTLKSERVIALFIVK